MASRSTPPFILMRLITWAPGISGNLGVKVNCVNLAISKVSKLTNLQYCKNGLLDCHDFVHPDRRQEFQRLLQINIFFFSKKKKNKMKVENGAPVIFLCCEKVLPENIRKPEVSRANKTNIRLFHRTPPNDCFFLIHFLLAHRDVRF